MFGLGSNTQLGIGIAIKLHDQFSQQAQQINNQLLKLRKNSQGALISAAQSYRNQAASIAAGAGAVSFAMFKAAQDGAEFQHKINQSFIIGGKGLGKSRKELEDYTLNLSKQFSIAPTAIANSMLENTKAGVRDNLEEITKYQMAAATAAGEPIEVVSEALLAAQHGYSIAAKDFSFVANTMVAAANASMSSLQDLGVGMEYAAFTAKRLKVPFQDLNVMLAMISQKGIRGSSAGTGISNFLVEMSKALGPFATKRQVAAFKMLGLDRGKMAELVNSGRSLEAIMAVEKSTTGMAPTNKVGILNALFNRRGDRGLAAVLEGLFVNPNARKTFSQIYNEVYAGHRDNIAIKQADAMMGDLHSQMILASNAMFRVKNAITHAMTPVLSFMIRAFIKVANLVTRIAESPIGKIFFSLVAVLAPFVAIMFAFRAAVITATLALRTIGVQSGVGGFRGIMGGLLGNMGSTMLMGASRGAIARNAAGRLYVAAGNTVNIAGKLYKGGQMLPKGMSAGSMLINGAGLGATAAGLAGGGAGAAGAAATAGSWASRALPWVARIGGTVLRFLPYLGAAYTIYEVVKGIYDLNREEKTKKELDPVMRAYYRQLDQQFLGYTQTPGFYNENQMSMLEKLQGSGKGASLQQQININVDGRQAMAQVIPQIINDDMNTQLNYDIPG
jgi:TP901 family phage tail tape measure protein